MSLTVILTPKDEAKDEVISAGEKALVCINIMVKKVKLLMKYVTEYSVKKYQRVQFSVEPS